MTEKFTVAKLTGSKNYASWATNLRIILKHHRHWTWIEGANEHLHPRKLLDPLLAMGMKKTPDMPSGKMVPMMPSTTS